MNRSDQTAPPQAPTGWIRPTTFLRAPRLAEQLGVDLILASETFQETGSFKFRAASRVVTEIPHPRVIAASSGNFGQALARACQLAGKKCTIVMPETCAEVKVSAVQFYGGQVDLIDVSRISRTARVSELAEKDPEAYIASAYDDPWVIAGNATLGAELGRCEAGFELVLAPVGGGGLTAGLVEGLKQSGSDRKVIGVEPTLANDAARSLRAGRILSNEREPQTLADGVRTLSLGQSNWQILQHGLAGIVEVSEDEIRESVRLLFGLANLKAEPTGALAVAALLAARERFAGRSLCAVISGGNVDPGFFCELIRSNT